VVGVDPVGSILAEPEELNVNSDSGFYEVEGVGYDFIPTVLDRSVVDLWVKTKDKESLITARRLIKEEGLLCGGSSGGNVWAALQVAKRLKTGQRCVVILPDGVRNYMTKFLNDNWMADRDFMDVDRELANKLWWWNLKISQLSLQAPVTISPSVSVQDATDVMDKEAFDQLPVINEDGSIAGVVTQGSLMSNLIANKVRPESPVESVLYKQFKKIYLHTTMGKLSRILDIDHFALVVHEQKQFTGAGRTSTKEVIVGIVTRIDLLNFVTSREVGDNEADATSGRGTSSGVSSPASH